MTPFAPAVAILPGSRPHEVRRLLEAMLKGFEDIRRDRASVDARVMLASSLDDKTRAWAKALAHAAEVDVAEIDPRTGIAPLLPAFDVALCASGTASLECALAEVVPVVCYRVGWAAEAAARAFLETPYVALPNVLLGRAAFPELLQKQRRREPHRRRASRTVLDERDRFVDALPRSSKSSATILRHHAAVARMLEPWLQRRRNGPRRCRPEARSWRR